MEEKSSEVLCSEGGWFSRLVPAGSGNAELKQARDDSSHEGEGIN